MRVSNRTTGKSLGNDIAVADTGSKRRTGLLKHHSMREGEGLWIVPCEAVHTFFMKFSIDVVFLSKDRKILKTKKSMPKSRIALCLRAHSVLELPPGTLERTGTVPGHQLEFSKLDG